MTPFLILIAFVLGVLVGSISKISINVTHTHKHNFSKKEAVDKPVENNEQVYNPSVGDPNTTLYLDQQFMRKEGDR